MLSVDVIGVCKTSSDVLRFHDQRYRRTWHFVRQLLNNFDRISWITVRLSVCRCVSVSLSLSLSLCLSVCLSLSAHAQFVCVAALVGVC